MLNRLAHETSPYLQQHAGNPVDWYPWGEEALRRAREQDKPILLSVGYSACHWCHVMAHESFEDVDIAAVMNRLFVNVKVDREERPDIDQIYQSAHQLLTRRAGGWPLTMFLTPDQRPFFGGTYFPKVPRYNLPGFADLCEHVARVYREQRLAIDAQNDELMTLLAATQSTGGGAEDPGSAAIEAALQELERLFDREHGGLGGAPKFPHPAELEFTLREGILRGDEELKHLALLTLREMARGGIYDHLGGGFARYSVDATWTIPHFEKMLYDNGPLLRLCAEAWQLSGEARFKSACEQTAGWIMREMQSPEGGYYSSLDADSEHEEGKFYVWSREEVRDALEPDEYALAARVYGLDGAPNFEGRHWHLRIAREIEDVARELGMARATAEEVLGSARAKLFAVREQRVRPGRDEKILASWNALAIHGMAHAARVFDRRDWLDSARRALAFVRGTMWSDSALRATFKDGKAHLNAYLDDHAFLLAALLETLQADFRIEELNFATALADALLGRFEDAESGGFFFTSHDHERLILRPKSAHDNATPSGNGVAAIALQRLGHLTGQPRYVQAAERTLRSFRDPLAAQPSAFPSLLVALAESLNPPAVVILRGHAVDTAHWLPALRAAEDPARMVLVLEPGLSGLPPSLDKPWTGGVNAWVCRGVTCLTPVSEVSGLLALLRG
jgi:uncharacterized protein YyaL (SSP411 family)